MLRPARKTPAEQLAYARELRDRGSVRRANRHYRALVASWPSAPEAPIALLERARLLDARGRGEDAFEAYRELLANYPGQFPFEEVLARQIAIASGELERRRMKFLFGGFTSPERAIPMLEHLVKAVNVGPEAARVRLLLGRAHEMNDEPEKAAKAYAEIEQRFADDPLAAEAGWRHVQCLREMSRRAPADRHLLESAWTAAERFVRRFPGSPRAAEATALRDALRQRLADELWREATYYDRRSARPTAAIPSYQRYAELFGDTERGALARERLQVLKQLAEKEKP